METNKFAERPNLLFLLSVVLFSLGMSGLFRLPNDVVLGVLLMLAGLPASILCFIEYLKLNRKKGAEKD